jgi:type III secretion protein R
MKRALFAVVPLLLVSTNAWAKPVAEGVDLNYSSRPVEMMALLGAMALAPFAVLMLTSFAKFSVVLSISRNALGSPSLPPTTVLTGLAVILSCHVMAPVVEDMYSLGKSAYEQSSTSDLDSVLHTASVAAEPMRAFLLKHGHADDREMFLDMARQLRGPERAAEVTEHDVVVVVPAFVISELKEAFEIGFLIFLPFLVVDMVVANVLMALGMSSLSPSQISLPFKLLLFVMVDGWHLLAQGLVLGYR